MTVTIIYSDVHYLLQYLLLIFTSGYNLTDNYISSYSPFFICTYFVLTPGIFSLQILTSLQLTMLQLPKLAQAKLWVTL